MGVCEDKQFHCSESVDNSCISSNWRCDGVTDCDAGEDEIDCRKSYRGDRGWVFRWPGRTKSIAVRHIEGTKVGFLVGRGGRNRLL